MASTPDRWDLEVDWVSIGSGLAGVCSAIAAHDLGASCAILEKAPRLGGLSGFGGGEVFVPNNHKMRELGIEDSDEAGRRYLAFIGAGFQDPALFDKLLATCKEAVEYFEREAGVRWIAVEGLPDYYYPKVPGAHARRIDPNQVLTAEPRGFRGRCPPRLPRLGAHWSPLKRRRTGRISLVG